jgi:hypothetical protein
VSTFRNGPFGVLSGLLYCDAWFVTTCTGAEKAQDTFPSAITTESAILVVLNMLFSMRHLDFYVE